MNDSAVAISERECPVVTRESLSVFIRLTDWANPVAEINPAAANSVIRLVICFVSILIFQFKLVHIRSEEHTSELQSLMRISYAVFCLKKKIKTQSQYNI